MRWNDINDIVKNLEEYYSDEDITELKLSDISDMVRSLEDFEDHGNEPDEECLERIYEAWLDLREED